MTMTGRLNDHITGKTKMIPKGKQHVLTGIAGGVFAFRGKGKQ